MSVRSICFIVKSRLEQAVPVVDVIEHFGLLGDLRLRVICYQAANSLKERMIEHGVSVEEMAGRPIIRFSKRCGGVAYNLAFRALASSNIGRIPSDLLWVGSLDTAAWLAGRHLAGHTILHVRELYDRLPLYRRILRRAGGQVGAIVVPEVSRAFILRCWCQLPRTPYVVPNKPLILCNSRKQDLGMTLTPPRAKLLQGKKLILYQGHIIRERPLDALVGAVETLGGAWALLLIGRSWDCYAEALESKSSRVTYGGYFPAPEHLKITSHARIGILSYDYSSLNQVFCAPNKLWEYAGFGVPMLASDCPPLRDALDRSHAGMCVDFDNVSAIAAALHQIDELYDEFSGAARELYKAVKVDQILRGILNDLCGEAGRGRNH